MVNRTHSSTTINRAVASGATVAVARVTDSVLAKAMVVNVVTRRLEIVRQWCLALLCLLALSLSGQLNAAPISAEINRQQLTIDETLTLTITSDGSLTGDLVLDALAPDFEVMGTSQSSQVNIVNGQMTNMQQWNVELVPTRIGDLLIPALSVGAESTQSLRVQVLAANTAGSASAGAQGGAQDVFLEAVVDNLEPYVQAQVIYTVKFYQAINILDGGLSDPAADQMKTHRLGDDTAYMTTLNGRQYRVRERRFALFAQESGQLIIPPVQLNITVSADPNSRGGFFGQTKTLRRRGPPITLNVKPRELANNTHWWLPAKSVRLDASWESGVTEFRVGEPVTRVIQLYVDGVAAEQLPVLSPPEVENLKIYQDKPELQTIPGRGSLSAIRAEKWAVIPQTAGEITLPEISIRWFDIESETEQVARLDAQTITVQAALTGNGAKIEDASKQNQAGAVNAATQSTSVINLNNENSAGQLNSLGDDGNQPGELSEELGLVKQSLLQQKREMRLWKWGALLALAAWLLTLIAWLWTRRSHAAGLGGQDEQHAKQQTLDQRKLLNTVERSINAGDPAGTTAALLQWSAAMWPNDATRSLQSLAIRCDDKLAGLLRQLDSYRYSGATRTEVVDRSSSKSAFTVEYSALVPELKRLSSYSATMSAPAGASRRGAKGRDSGVLPQALREAGLPEL